MEQNIFYYASFEQQKFETQAREFGYTPKTTFYSDLSIAEVFGISSIKDTFNNVCKSWINNHEFFTEFILCLNWKSWEFAETNEELAMVYAELYEKADKLFYEHYENNQEVLNYYFRVTD